MQEQDMKEAFALFDKQGNNSILSSSIGDLLRAVGHNPSQVQINELTPSSPTIDYETFLKILPKVPVNNGTFEEYVQALQVFDKDGCGFISAGELRYVLTCQGEKLSEGELDELLNGAIGKDGMVQYDEWVRTIMSG